MVHSMVERATSDMLIGPDWAMNIEICDMCSHDPGQSKDVVKGIKRRIGSRNAKVQLLALTLLETLIKNCGDIVHMHVAEKDILHDMVKIVKKKPDLHVKEKILVLVDTWQEVLGGPRARYPQYYAAYQELLRAGAVFPPRSERAAPVFTPPQTQPLSSYPTNLRSSENRLEGAESSAESEFPTLSLTEIQNARGIMDVLTEMLSALDPENKEGLSQEVIVDLVDQCRTYKQRVVHLVNSTSDESLLCQGLSLNDELQRVLAKHEALSSGTSAVSPKSKPQSSGGLVDVGGPLVDTGDTPKGPDGGSPSTSGAAAGTLNQLLLTAPPATNGSTASVSPKMDLLSGDLLSGDDYSSPKADPSLAIVPVSEPQPNTPPSQQNALVLFDMFPDTNNPPNAVNAQPGYLGPQISSLPPQFQQQPSFHSPEVGVYFNGAVPNMGSPRYELSQYMQTNGPAWNGHAPQPQQPSSPTYGGQINGALPPPPWEAQPAETSLVVASQYPPSVQVTQVVVTVPTPQAPQPMANDQSVGMYMQPTPTGHFQPMQNNQYPGMYPQQAYQGGQQQYMNMHPQQMHGGQMTSMYPQQMYGNQMAGYGYGQQQQQQLQQQQQQQQQYLEQRMYGLSVADDSGLRNSNYQVSSTSSYVHPNKPAKPEDKLFGDLVDIAKFKPTK